jgi:hypothetical protein
MNNPVSNDGEAMPTIEEQVLIYEICSRYWLERRETTDLACRKIVKALGIFSTAYFTGAS